VALPADLAAEGAATRLRDAVASRGLGVDLLVNNAGLGQSAPFVEQDPSRVRAMLDVNVRAVVEMTHAFLPAMIERGRGRVVNVASNAAFQAVPFLTVYAATKAFVLSFTEGIAEELKGTGVRVQALCPGFTETEFLQLAGTDEGLGVSRTPRLSVDEVVETSLRALDRGKLRVITGWLNWLGVFAQRFLPASLPRRVGAELHRPPKTGGAAP
jgi:short-subunit dehydrogenase